MRFQTLTAVAHEQCSRVRAALRQPKAQRGGGRRRHRQGASAAAANAEPRGGAGEGKVGHVERLELVREHPGFGEDVNHGDVADRTGPRHAGQESVELGAAEGLADRTRPGLVLELRPRVVGTKASDARPPKECAERRDATRPRGCDTAAFHERAELGDADVPAERLVDRAVELRAQRAKVAGVRAAGVPGALRVCKRAIEALEDR